MNGAIQSGFRAATEVHHLIEMHISFVFLQIYKQVYLLLNLLFINVLLDFKLNNVSSFKTDFFFLKIFT